MRTASKVLLMDGSMSAQLKKFGYDAMENPPHWTFPANGDIELMRKLYSSFLDLGVDIITTNTYQFGSTLDESLNEDEATKKEHLQNFKNACDVLCDLIKERKSDAQVWGSVGTVATTFHDMSEYHGNYADLPDAFTTALNYFVTILGLFHRETSIRNLVFETLPTEIEALAALQALKQFPDFKAVVSFTFMANASLRHGEKIGSVAEKLKQCDQVVGMGINCTDPKNVLAALREIKKHNFPHIFVYPNYGDAKLVDSTDTSATFSRETVAEWIENGATVLGGCCGVDETEMRYLKGVLEQLNGSSPPK